jgi:hypothetical protein
MPTKKRFQTRLDPDDADSVESFADDHDITQSEALRRLIQRGLDADDSPDAEAIRDDLRDLRREIDTDDGETETHRMAQMGATEIGAAAVGFAAVGLVYSQLPPTLPPAALAALAVAAVVLVGYGLAPLARTTD